MMKKNIIIPIIVCVVFFVLILIIRNNIHTIERQENELANERCKYEYSDLESSEMNIENLIDKSGYFYSV
jgi:poly-D-alanine transfer protein DltD